MRLAAAAACLAAFLGGCADTVPGGDPGLAQAVRNYPPMIISPDTVHVTGADAIPRSCPKPGGRVDQRGAPSMVFLGTSPQSPDLCRLRIGDEMLEAWFGIWGKTWPGAEAAYPAMRHVIMGHVGDVTGFDTVVGPGLAWHDLVRNEGVEDISLLGVKWRALRLSHYREGFDGNTYRSLSTVWKDIPSGLLIFGTYQHIAGRPEIDDPILPTAIVPAP
jgi:hypothetical protein